MFKNLRKRAAALCVAVAFVLTGATAVIAAPAASAPMAADQWT